MIEDIIKQHINVSQGILSIVESINIVSKVIISSLRNGGKILIFGNGGSAGDSQHIAAEFINKFRFDRKPLPAIALTTDSSIITAISNDSGYQHVFEKQIQALGSKGDIALAITTSDFSNNDNHSKVMEFALKVAKEKNMVTIGLVSKKSKNILELLDYSIIVPSTDTPRIQESHILIAHILCEIVESNLFKEVSQ
jgi:D-sedoheptulose 7-phosphate isomerase